MSKLIFKAAYSRPMQYKRHLLNMHKLNEFLGRNLLDEEQNKNFDEFSLSNDSRINKHVTANRSVTYSELLERIAHAEKNYDDARVRQLGGNDSSGAARDLVSQYGSK